MFCFGAPADYQPNEDMFEMLSTTAACLEKNYIDSMYYVNMDATRFRGKFFVKSRIGMTQLEIAERALKEFLDDRSSLAGHIRYFFFWNKDLSGGFDASVPHDSTLVINRN